MRRPILHPPTETVCQSSQSLKSSAITRSTRISALDSSRGSRRSRCLSTEGAIVFRCSSVAVESLLSAAKARALRTSVNSPRNPSVPSARHNFAAVSSRLAGVSTLSSASRARCMRRRNVLSLRAHRLRNALRSLSNASLERIISTRVGTSEWVRTSTDKPNRSCSWGRS